MTIKAVTVEVDHSLLASLAAVLGMECTEDALDLALRRLADILEIEMLNEDTDDRYWPDFEPLGYLTCGGSATGIPEA